MPPRGLTVHMLLDECGGCWLLLHRAPIYQQILILLEVIILFQFERRSGWRRGISWTSIEIITKEASSIWLRASPRDLTEILIASIWLQLIIWRFMMSFKGRMSEPSRCFGHLILSSLCLEDKFLTSWRCFGSVNMLLLQRRMFHFMFLRVFFLMDLLGESSTLTSVVFLLHYWRWWSMILPEQWCHLLTFPSMISLSYILLRSW